MYAEVLIEYPTKKIDKFFSYDIPPQLQNIVKVGMKVKVPFGNKIINGIILKINNIYNKKYELKKIIDVIDKEVVLNDELIKLGFFLNQKTLCPLISAYQTMLPNSLKIKDNNTNYNYYRTYLVLDKNHNEIIEYLNNYKKTNKQTELLNILLKENRIEKKDVSSYVIKSLIEKKLIREIKEQEYRISKSINNNTIKHELNDEQKAAYNKVINTNSNEVFLLEGVTGSGKTEVYLHLIDTVINNGKSAILLLPEISLTMQIVNRFYEWFGNKVAIIHSSLSNGEKYDEYLKIVRGEVSIVIGTRSAIFMPLKNIGIIIIDEEHSDTYKQESTPRYNAIDVAKERVKYHNCPLVLGSATPTLESRARAIKGVYKHLLLNKRAGQGTLPTVKIVDMTKEFKKRNFVFSEELINKINDCLEKKEQIIILLNRRGYSTTITCSNCGYTYKCPNCDITLTYHKTSNNLKCHYCGYTTTKDNLCHNCHENSLNYLGMGTEKIELEINKLFSNAKVIRMDQDTTLKKGAHEKIINDFKNHQYDILLGTQMISKGLDFPNVTLVGIINADSTLNIPDFRSNERCFSLLYQASGRAGRSNLKGEVIIQTYNPDNYILHCVQNNDYNSFYNYEMNIRRIMKYPPYYYLISLKIVAKEYNIALSNANKTIKYLNDNLDSNSIILGPTTANIFKYNNTYRFQIVIKYRFDSKLNETLKELDNIFINNQNASLEIDIDPLHI